MITLNWNAVERTDWQGLLGQARSGLQQGWSYGEALRLSGVPVHRAVVRDVADRPLGCLQVADRRLLGPIGAGFLLRGPVWLHQQSAQAFAPQILAAIRGRLRRRMLVWAPEDAKPHARHPVITGYSTSWLDLARGSETLRGALAADWRSCLRQAEASGLSVRRLATPHAIAWLLGPTRRFLGPLAETARESRELLLLLAFERAEPVAGIMILRHGISATYEVGYVGPRGRTLRATHLLLWHAVEALIRKQVRWLDLGGIATDRSPGIARFKLGMGGAIATLPGTFLIGGGVRCGADCAARSGHA